MKKFRDFIEKKHVVMIVFCMITAVLGLVSYGILANVIEAVLKQYYVSQILGRLFAGMIVLAFIFTYFKAERKELGFGIKGFGQGIRIGLVFALIVIGFTLYETIQDYSGYTVVRPQMSTMLLTIICAFVIGFYEELLCRGLLLNIILRRERELTYHAKVKAIVISSLIFASMHVINFFSSPELIMRTVAQIVFAFALGLFGGAVYLRSNNIWAVVFFHAIVDLSYMLPQDFFQTSAELVFKDYVEKMFLIKLAIQLVYLAIAGFMCYRMKSNKQRDGETVNE